MVPELMLQKRIIENFSNGNIKNSKATHHLPCSIHESCAILQLFQNGLMRGSEKGKINFAKFKAFPVNALSTITNIVAM